MTEYQARMLMGALIFGGEGSISHFAGRYPYGADRTQRIYDLVRAGLLDRVEPAKRNGRQKDAFIITEKGRVIAEVLMELEALNDSRSEK